MIPAFLPATMMALSAGMQAFGILGQGDAAVKAAERRKQAAEFEAQQLDINAGQAVAASQRTAYFEDQKGDLMLSRLKALSAASGAGATDPTVLNLQAGLMQQKAYNLASALYGGEDKARSMRMEASSKRYQADLGLADAEETKSASKLSAAASLLSGGAKLYSSYPSMFEKYGIS
jgi:hypothetical protein